MEAIAVDRPTEPVLPAVASGPRLPLNYTEAKAALERCENLDEIASWSNKAAAIESYAAMARDTTLARLARRIRLRAIRRAGQLLATIPPSPGRRFDLRPDSPVGARTKAAQEAGLSTSQRKTALRIARIPAETFEAACEHENPPGAARLAGLAELRPAPVTEDPAGAFKRACGLLSALICTYRELPPLLRQKLRNRALRAFADSLDAGDDRLDLAQISPTSV